VDLKEFVLNAGLFKFGISLILTIKCDATANHHAKKYPALRQGMNAPKFCPE
jgi:hypothetical protein